MISFVRAALAGAAFLTVPLPALAAELVMVEQAGCHYCARWNAEIGPIYPRTAEGAYAPLRKVEIGGREMGDIALKRREIHDASVL